jgi:hypothetical protein
MSDVKNEDKPETSIPDRERAAARVLNNRVEKLAKALCESLEANALSLAVSYSLETEDGKGRDVVCFASPAANKEEWIKHVHATRSLCHRLILNDEAEKAAKDEEDDDDPSGRPS